jgi:hypothetical protein
LAYEARSITQPCARGRRNPAGIAEFTLDSWNTTLAGEAADWNLLRRMLAAGVRCEFVERIMAA